MQTPPPPSLDSATAISYLIAAGGNSKLAAVQASRELNASPPITEALLLTTIAQDPSSLTPLATQLNLLVMLNTVEAFRITHTAYLQKIDALSPKETAKAYTTLLQSLSLMAKPPNPATPLTAPDQLTNDPRAAYEAVIDLLPPNVAEAVEFFVRNPQASNSTTQSDAPSAATASPSAAIRRADTTPTTNHAPSSEGRTHAPSAEPPRDITDTTFIPSTGTTPGRT